MDWRRDRWFVLGVLLLLVNARAVRQMSRGSPGGPWPSRVVAFEAGKDGVVTGDEAIRWQFNTPVAEASDVGVWRAEGPATFQPVVQGRFCWLSDRVLAFEPAANWPLCTEYEVRLDREIGDQGKHVLRRRREHTFQTPSLELRSVTQAGFSPGRRITLRLNFNVPPVRSRLTDHISIVGADGRNIAFDLRGRTETRTVTLRSRSLPPGSFRLKARKGLPATVGPLGLARDSTWELQLHDRLVPLKSDVCMPPFEPGHADVYFSSEISIHDVEQHVSVSPDMEVAVTAMSDWDGPRLRVRGDFAPGQSYTVRFHKGLCAANGAILQKDSDVKVRFPDRPAAIDLPAAGHYLSPRGSCLLPLSAVNVAKIRAEAEYIFPNNLVYFAMRQSDRYPGYYARHGGGHHRGISRVAGDREYSLPAVPNQASRMNINMPDLTGDYASGAFLVTVSGEKCATRRHLVVVTDIGIAVKQATHGLLVWANSIHSLEPVAGAVVRVFSGENQLLAEGSSDRQGLVALALDTTQPGNTPFLVTVQRGDDVSYLKLEGAAVGLAGDTDGAAYLNDGCEAYLFTDRGVYRPGETAHLRAIVRDRSLNPASPFPVSLRIERPDGQLFRRLTGMLSTNGTAEFEVPWPNYARTGAYTLDACLPASDKALGSTTVWVEEFVPPQIKVDVTIAGERATTNLLVDAERRHLFGRPAAGLAVNGAVRFVPMDFSHPAWPGFGFSDKEKDFSPVDKKIGRGRLDGSGAGRFSFPIPAAWRPCSALKAVVRATVTETSGRAVSAYASCPVDVYPHYVGIRPRHAGNVVRAGQPVQCEIAAVLPDGNAATNVNALTLQLARVEWATVLREREDGALAYESQRRLNPVLQRRVDLAEGTAQLDVTPRTSGQYVLSVADGDGGSASTGFYAAGADRDWLAWSLERPGHASMELDRTEYRAGDTATLVIKSPFAGKALLTVETDRVLETRVFELEGNTAEISLPVDESYAPNAYCCVSVIRPVKAGEPSAVHRAVGVAPLRVSRPEQELSVHLHTPERIEPQSPLTVDLHVTDFAGGAATGEVTVAVVDEGICTLTGFRTPDPLRFFERKRKLGVALYDLYSLLMPETEDTVLGSPSVPGGDTGGGLTGRLNPIDARRFKPVALWRSPVALDAGGRTKVRFSIPEFTGRLRVMAVAAGSSRFGAAQSHVTVKRDLVVLSSLPRFLAPGDTCSLPVRVFNESGTNLTVRAVVDCVDGFTVDPRAGTNAVAAGQQSLFDFSLRAGNAAGVGRLVLRVEGNGIEYEEDFELPVRPASPRITRSGYGSLNPGEDAVVCLPRNWLPGTGQEWLWCSALPDLRLQGGLNYLLQYPYGCLEQTTSRSFPLLHLAAIAAKLCPASVPAGGVREYAGAGIRRILSMQLGSGGFGYWPRSDTLYRWGSLYATHFLVEAQREGHEVPEPQLDLALAFVSGMLEPDRQERRSTRESRDDLRAYAAYILSLAGKPPHGWIARLREKAAGLNATPRLHVAGALAASGKRREAGELMRVYGIAAAESAAREVSGTLSSGPRNLAIQLSVWLDIDPGDPFVPLLVRRLEGAMNEGRWHNTQDNAMAVLALGKYCRHVQGETGSFSGVASWEDPDGQVSHNLRNGKEQRFDTTRATDGEIALRNTGETTLYYAWSSAGIVEDGSVRHEDRQLAVRREWLDLEGEPLATDVFTQGQMVVIGLVVDTQGEALDNLVIEDLLPAGLEVENASLKTSQVVPWIKARQGCPVRHVDVRDDRVVLFTGPMCGREAFYYVARAVTPGRFVYPPVAAECMYDASIRSVHGTGVATVVE